jgi:hypothetical protein
VPSRSACHISQGKRAESGGERGGGGGDGEGEEEYKLEGRHVSLLNEFVLRGVSKMGGQAAGDRPEKEEEGSVEPLGVCA